MALLLAGPSTLTPTIVLAETIQSDRSATWSERDLNRAFQRVEAMDELQRDLPGTRPSEPEPEDSRDQTVEPWRLDLSWLEPWLPYIATGLLVIIILLNIPQVRAWLDLIADRFGRSQQAVVPAVDHQPMIGLDRDNLLVAADRLAAAGHYGKACGLLLNHILPRLAEVVQQPWHPSTTAREAVRRFGLAPSERDQLADVVRVSERGQFAGGALDRPDYDQARQAIRTLEQWLADQRIRSGAVR
ncbi:MAG: DUF4129 domain-containing protein [Pseudomonadota bacterium]